jgi:hypothetical protein
MVFVMQVQNQAKGIYILCFNSDSDMLISIIRVSKQGQNWVEI